MNDKVVDFITKNDMRLYKKILKGKHIEKYNKKLENILLSKFDKITNEKIKEIKRKISEYDEIFRKSDWTVTPYTCTIRKDPISIQDNPAFKDWMVKGDLVLDELTGYFIVPNDIDESARIYSEEFLTKYIDELLEYRKLHNELDNIMTAFFELKDESTNVEEVVATANYLGYKRRSK